jgi:UDP-glucose 4-epimerase
MLIARSERLKQRLDWQPKYDDLDFIVRTALLWEQKLARKPA